MGIENVVRYCGCPEPWRLNDGDDLCWYACFGFGVLGCLCSTAWGVTGVSVYVLDWCV